MRQSKSVMFVLILILPVVLSGITGTAKAEISPSYSVAVSIAPLSGIVRQIGGPYVETSILLSEGVEPHAFTVTPEVIKMAKLADLLVFTGHFEWENDLAVETATPFITMDDLSALENYDDYGAELSPFPGENHEDGDEHHHDHDGNPHGWWLLPSNAIAIANATRAALSALNASMADVWNAGFDHFISEIEDLQDLIQEADDKYHFSTMKSIVVFPAEAYVAEAFGIEVVAVLISEGQTISGGELVEVQNAIRNGSISLILGSDVARMQSAGEFAYQLLEDYGGTLVWWRAVFFSGLSDYTGIMTYNLGALSSALEERRDGSSATLLNYGLIGLSAILGVIAVAEALLLYNKLRQ